MVHMGSDILGLPPRACSAESSTGAGAGAAVANNGRGMGVQSDLAEFGGLSSLTSSGALGDEFNAFGPHKTRSVRNFWSVHEDVFLMSVVIDNRDLLLIPSKSRPRSRFWHHISDELRQQHGFERNKRQCRDRFNLLFWKAVRNRKPDTEDTRELDRLLLQCLKLFYFDKNNSIMLRDQTERDQAAPADAGAAPTPVSVAAPTGVPLQHRNNSPRSETDDSPSSSGGYYPDMSTDSLADMACFLQRQVYTLNRKVDELCGVLAMQRSRLDYMVSSKTGSDSSLAAFPVLTPQTQQQQQHQHQHQHHQQQQQQQQHQQHQQQMLQHPQQIQHPHMAHGAMYSASSMTSVPEQQLVSAQPPPVQMLDSLSTAYVNDNYHHTLHDNQSC